MGVKIAAIGCYRPQNYVVSVSVPDQVAADLDVKSFSKFIAGNVDRHEPPVEETVLAMSTKAIEDCLGKCNFDISDIDLIIHLSTIPDHLLGEATKIQREIGATRAASYQLKNVACAGSLVAFIQACTLIQENMYRNVLVVCVANAVSRSRTMSDVTGSFMQDLATATLFTQCNAEGGFNSVYCKTLAKLEPDSHLLPVDHGMTEQLMHKNGEMRTLRQMLNKYDVATMRKTLAMARLQPSDIDWFVTPNARDELRNNWHKSLGIAPDRHLHTFDKIGNCSISSIPYTIMCAMEKELFSTGDRILLYAEGAGLHLVAAVWQW